MSATVKAGTVLDRVYLEVRSKLLDVAAALDRIERAEGGTAVQGDARWKQLLEGVALLENAGAERAEKIQMLFSDPYVPNWSRRNGAKADDRR